MRRRTRIEFGFGSCPIITPVEQRYINICRLLFNRQALPTPKSEILYKRRGKMNFRNIHADPRIKAAIYILVLFSLFAAQTPLGHCAEVTEADRNAYLKALIEAEDVTQEKISARLLAIVPDYDRINHEILNEGAIRWEGVTVNECFSLWIAFRWKRQNLPVVIVKEFRSTYDSFVPAYCEIS